MKSPGDPPSLEGAISPPIKIFETFEIIFHQASKFRFCSKIRTDYWACLCLQIGFGRAIWIGALETG
jgi:hypothetical protein